MKNRTLALLLLMSLSAAGATLVAQSDPPPPPPSDQSMDTPPPYDPQTAAQPADPQGAPPAAYDQQGAPQQPAYYPQGAPQQPAYYPPGAPQPGYAPPGASPDVMGGPSQQAAADPTAVFYDQLSPYGGWVNRPGYGAVWVPQVEAGWRPYTNGHWVYTDDGWAWVSDEPWGWAAYHYGRWFYDSQIGWGWVPGTVWAPAWVSWRNGGGYIGWAPLPPTVGWTAGVGIELGGVDVSFGIRPESYTFVAEGAILQPRIATVIVPTVRNVVIVRTTTNITNITVVNNRVVNRGLAVERVERVTGRPVPRLQIAAMATVGAGPRTQVRGSQVSFYQPPAIARVARDTRAEFGKAGVPVVVQPKAAVVAAGRGRVPVRPVPGGAAPVGPRTDVRTDTRTDVRTDTRNFNASPVVNPRDLQNRHAAEKAQLAAQQNAERQQLQDRQKAERAKAAQGGTNAKELADRHAGEQRALDQQHQKQQQDLQARHQQEAAAAQKKASPKPDNNERKPPAQR